MLVSKKFIVSGRVQGVGFRYNTLKQASILGIKGYAKNMIDGTVEVAAIGEEKDVEKLKLWLSSGPELSIVQNIIEYEIAPLITESFEIY